VVFFLGGGAAVNGNVPCVQKIMRSQMEPAQRFKLKLLFHEVAKPFVFIK
jgi:hypothetical protein